MRTKSLLLFAVTMMATIVFTVGCQEPSKDAAGKDQKHAHAHDHPPHGPNHGHLFDFDSDEFVGEWCQYPDNNVVRFYLLDAKSKSKKPLVVEQFLVKPLVGNDDKSFELEAEKVDAEGATHSFMLDELLLRNAIPLGVEIEVITDDGKTMKGKIKEHKPLDH